MATLNDPVKVQEIIDRFKDFVDATANSSVEWGTDVKPFPELTDADAAMLFGGTTNEGRSNTLTDEKINKNNVVSAQDIIDALLAETTAFTRLRNIQIILNVTGGGGNTGTRPKDGRVFEQTKKANLSSAYIKELSQANLPPELKVSRGKLISIESLEELFEALKSAYLTETTNAGATPTADGATPAAGDNPYIVSVCHASCHSSCHGSRGRR